jgi:hypothetical protein
MKNTDIQNIFGHCKKSTVSSCIQMAAISLGHIINPNVLIFTLTAELYQQPLNLEKKHGLKIIRI